MPTRTGKWTPHNRYGAQNGIKTSNASGIVFNIFILNRKFDFYFNVSLASVRQTKAACKLLTYFSRNSFYLQTEPLRLGKLLTNHCIIILLFLRLRMTIWSLHIPKTKATYGESKTTLINESFLLCLDISVILVCILGKNVWKQIIL